MERDIKFNDLLFKALDHAIDSVSTGETLIPFVLTPSDLHRFPSDILEQGKKEAENFINNNAQEPHVILAYDGYVTVGGEKSNSVLVKGINREKNEVVTLAQRYKPLSSGEFTVVGNPILISKNKE